MNDKLSILQVVHGFPPREQAGAELHCFFLARELADRGHRVAAFSRRESRGVPVGAVAREEYRGIPIDRVNRPMDRLTSLVEGCFSPAVRRAFIARLAEGFQAVHFHHLYGLSADLAAAARAAGALVLFTLHDFWFLCPRGQMFDPRGGGRLCPAIDPDRCRRCTAKKRLRFALNAFTGGAGRGLFPNPARGVGRGARYLARNLHTRPVRDRLETLVGAVNQADIILSPSRFLLDLYRRHGLSPERSRWFENGMGDSWAAGLPERREPGRPIRFGFIGSFLHSKGVELLVDAYQEMPRGKGELHLHGTSPWDGGDYAAFLQARNRHEDVHFHGPFPHERLPGIMAGLDVLVVPSRWFENAPLTLDEASLARIPVIATGHGGMAEAVDRRRNGLLFTPDDPADLRRALLRFCDEPELWHRLREPAEPVKSMAEQAAKVEEMIRRGLAER